ncbi:hypothetical protein BH10PSE18_BH10PSE18_08290 [soil metagenome]
MKTTNVTVTALKAPWPVGAALGSVVAFKGEPPAWALGKFNLAPEGVKADFAYEPSDVVDRDASVTVQGIDPASTAARYMGQAQAYIDDLRAKHDDDLRKQNDQGGKALQEALDANAKLQAELAAAKEDADGQRRLATDLRAKLDDAEKDVAAAAKPAKATPAAKA